MTDSRRAYHQVPGHSAEEGRFLDLDFDRVDVADGVSLLRALLRSPGPQTITQEAIVAGPPRGAFDAEGIAGGDARARGRNARRLPASRTVAPITVPSVMPALRNSSASAAKGRTKGRVIVSVTRFSVKETILDREYHQRRDDGAMRTKPRTRASSGARRAMRAKT